MKPVEFIYLSQEDIVSLQMPMDEVIPIVENVFSEHGLGHFENPPKPGIHPQPDGFIHGMPGYLPRQKAAGLKWVSSFSSNAALGIPPVMGLFILNDVQTGQPLAVMDCRWITAMRTGAVSAVAARYLAVKNAAIVGIIGAGIQGRYNLLALAAAMPTLKSVRVFDIHPQTSDDFVAGFAGKLQLQFEIFQSAQKVIEGADIIVTATGSINRFSKKSGSQRAPWFCRFITVVGRTAHCTAWTNSLPTTGSN